jgi:hypothetical protein
MIVFFLLLVIAAMALGILGVVVKGLFTCCSLALACSLSPSSWAPFGCGGEAREGVPPGNFL